MIATCSPTLNGLSFENSTCIVFFFALFFFVCACSSFICLVMHTDFKDSSLSCSIKLFIFLGFSSSFMQIKVKC